MLQYQISRRRLRLNGIDSFPNDAATWAFASSEAPTPGSLPILVDLDGTLSDPTHRRHYLCSKSPDWVRFSLAADQDSPHLPVISWLRCNYTENPIIIASGRPSYVLPLTQLWLTRHDVRWDAIALRPQGDIIPGFRHKIRIVSALKELGLMPRFAIDDSEQAALAYRNAGVRCFMRFQDVAVE
jgi:hypothetical protein